MQFFSSELDTLYFSIEVLANQSKAGYVNLVCTVLH
uniref:Uncharacterized protein n=1 Tax=Arundo donax TaxID=35708 RepID=A0A0A9EGA2_ARUDO